MWQLSGNCGIIPKVETWELLQKALMVFINRGHCCMLNAVRKCAKMSQVSRTRFQKRGCFRMVKEIKKKEIMTLEELKKKYATKWFQYVIVGEINYLNPYLNMCYVIFTADSEEELFKTPTPEHAKQHNGGIASGFKVVVPKEVGGIYTHA